MNSRIVFGAVGAAGLLAVSGVAIATTSDTPTTTTSSSSSSSITLPAGSVLATRVTTFCGNSDEIVERLQKRQAALAEKGDDARAKAEKRLAKLKEHNFPKRADALQKRLDRRENLPDRIAEVQKAAAECDSLGLS
ncbi:hypothetical protein ACIB24_13355 [Spongisporangium articulatum]|uniref:Secreted protein n=1 Tax=Spongisporangium articulatum TaxID=3362603 RepID=A0ABW8AQ49_9ACTN